MASAPDRPATGRAMRWIRAVVAAVGFGGGLAFAAACAWSWLDPLMVERMARAAILAEVRARVEVQVDALDDRGIAALAQRFAARERAEAAALRERWKRRLPEAIDLVAARMLDPDCGCRDPEADAARLQRGLDAWYSGGIALAEGAAARLEALIATQYQDVAANLLREYRIFTATNAFVLLMLGAAVLVKRGAGVHLLPAALLVVVASALVSHAYLFKQDWLRTIVFAEWTGLWFVAYIAGVSLLLADLVFNGARITVQVLNALFSAIGAAFSAC